MSQSSPVVGQAAVPAPRVRSIDIVALVLAVSGGLLGIGGLIGFIMVVTSGAWNARQKLFAVFLLPGTGIVALHVIHNLLYRGHCDSTITPATATSGRTVAQLCYPAKPLWPHTPFAVYMACLALSLVVAQRLYAGARTVQRRVVER